jgi:hypothetical protein
MTTMSTDAQAVVLAAPERKRILRELLTAPTEAWTASQRDLYRAMIDAEYRHVIETLEDDVTQDIATEAFATLVFEGIPEADARDYADQCAAQASKRGMWGKTEGQRARERRQTFRDAVTARDGALAVTTGLVTTCIVCGGPFRKSYRRVRRDSAYCSDACRQSAYRRRRGKENDHER